jgi:predicted nucleic acid-binding protein
MNKKIIPSSIINFFADKEIQSLYSTDIVYYELQYGVDNQVNKASKKSFKNFIEIFVSSNKIIRFSEMVIPEIIRLQNAIKGITISACDWMNIGIIKTYRDSVFVTYDRDYNNVLDSDELILLKHKEVSNG